MPTVRGAAPTYGGAIADDVLGTPDGSFDVQLYALSAVVYAERGDEILLLKRAGGALSGQWFLPGGAVERGELPEDGARRELRRGERTRGRR